MKRATTIAFLAATQAHYQPMAAVDGKADAATSR